MNWQDHIHSDPAILAGKPLIKGTRLSVEFLLDCWPKVGRNSAFSITIRSCQPSLYRPCLPSPWSVCGMKRSILWKNVRRNEAFVQ